MSNFLKRVSVMFIILVLALVFGQAAPAPSLQAQTDYFVWLPLITSVKSDAVYQTAVPPLPDEDFATATADFVIWIPGGGPVRAVYMDKMLCKGGDLGDGIPREALATFARKWNVAVMGISGVCRTGRGADRATFQALEDFAEQAGQPELTHAPLLLYGFSITTLFVGGMLTDHPDRVAAAVQRGGDGRIRKTYTPAINEVPVMLTIGEKDTGFLNGVIEAFALYRGNDAVMSQAITPNEGHNLGDSKIMTRIFFDAVLEQRLPASPPADGPVQLQPMDRTQAWLGNNQTYEIAPVDSYQGDPLQASWLPDEATALKWQQFVKTNKVEE